MPASDLAGFRDLFRGKLILWQFFFGGYCVGLDELLPIRWVSCLDEGSDFDLIRRECGIEFCTVEQPGQRRHNWIGSGIEAVFESCSESIERMLRAFPKQDCWVTSSPACGRLEAFCLRSDYRYIGVPSRVASRFKSKQRLQEALRVAGLPRSEGLWLRLGEKPLAELQAQFGSRLVLQSALGAAGSGTFRVRNQDDFTKAGEKLADADVYASPYLGDLSLNINAAVIGGQAFAGYPNVQLSGVDQLEAPWGGYSGNDYAAARYLDDAILHDVQEQTERVGSWLASEGFEGLYGLDYVISERDGRVYAVDLNPRWQGSTALSTQLELAAGRLPLAAAEFAYRGRLIDGTTVELHREHFRSPLEGAQMCLRVPRGRAHRVREAVRPGVYRSGSGAGFSRSAVRFPGDLRDDEWLLLGGTPRSGTTTDPGAWLAHIYGKLAVVGERSSELTPWASTVAAAAYRSLGFDRVF